MAETLTPNQPQRQQQRLPRIQSPTGAFFLGSNDDNLERVQARVARAAAIRRKSLAARPPLPEPDPICLDKQQIIDLFHNCIKLASENKINQKNTWELSLIDHLYDIIKVEEEEDVETNFQKDIVVTDLGVIVNQFDKDNKRPLDNFPSHQEYSNQFDHDNGIHDNDVGYNAGAFDNCGSWNVNQDDQGSVFDGNSSYPDVNFTSYDEDNKAFSFDSADIDDRFENVDGYLFLNLGFTSKQNAWAGPDHWKYRKVKGLEDNSTSETGAPVANRNRWSKKQVEHDIDFTKALNEELPDVFAPPKIPKALLLPANRAQCNTTLPEDCHYQPENLVKLFLLPNMMCLGNRAKRSSGQHSNEYEPISSWVDSGVFDNFDDGNTYSDVEDPNTLVSQPRQLVNKIEIQYNKTSKQVDVQVLKETLWNHIRELTLLNHKEAVSFRHLLACFPVTCKAAASIDDISPHLCFICLLHLANEHGMAIKGSASLDDLSVYLARNYFQENLTV